MIKLTLHLYKVYFFKEIAPSFYDIKKCNIKNKG